MKKFCIFLLYAGLLHSNHGNAQSPALQHGKNEVNIIASDGVNLSTDVFLPRGKGKFPVVLVRTPYNKNAEAWMGKAFNLFHIAVVVQDVRGKYKSGGSFYPFVNERADGLQTLRWIRQQEWCNGRVAGWGGSYVGFTQWAISDSLDFLTLLLTGAKLYDFVYPDSLFSLQTAYTWGTINAAKEANNIPKEKLDKAILTLPVSMADDSAVKDIDYYNDWIRHNSYDEYWAKLDFRGKTQAPVLSMAGWYDLFLKAQIADFEALADRNSPASRMVIGPWCHGKQGEENTYGGEKKTGKSTQIFSYVKAYLKGRKTKLGSPLKDSRYNLFIMERNEYVGSDCWPPKESSLIPFYLAEGNQLSQKVPEENKKLEYRYSPADPYPSHGGTALGDGVGPARQNANVNRTDQLVFEYSIVAEPLILLGPVSARLWVSSSAPCTDFIVCLQDEFPDGKIINIQEGGAKVQVQGADPCEREISVWATGYQLNPGHKLRVVISSSWFPRFNRSLNTCDPAFSAVNMQDATQIIHTGPLTPSAVYLPVYTMKSK
ncbi:MAG: CocE/NonD family hydrolase [Bacteroidales bacterium]